MITKAGVLAVLRVIYYLVGADVLRGTWVQKGFMTLTLITVSWARCWPTASR